MTVKRHDDVIQKISLIWQMDIWTYIVSQTHFLDIWDNSPTEICFFGGNLAIYFEALQSVDFWSAGNSGFYKVCQNSKIGSIRE